MDDEREVHRHRVIALVDQRFGEIERGDAGALEEAVPDAADVLDGDAGRELARESLYEDDGEE